MNKIIVILINLLILIDGLIVDHIKNSYYNEAVKFLDSYMNPTNCQSSEYIVVQMGGGGLASHFQLAATEWLTHAAYSNYTIPVLIMGKIIGYSDSDECLHVNHEWTCFFQPLSICQNELLASGKRLSPNIRSKDYMIDSAIPNQFRHLGLAFWWGVVQSRMFRLQSNVIRHIDYESSIINNGKGFPFNQSVAGIHVRHGDKKHDGFVDKSFESELIALSKSPQCLYNNLTTNLTINICIRTTNSSTNITYLPIFVASDDLRVLNEAQRYGYLYTTPGISQQTNDNGMVQTLLRNNRIGYNASIEVIKDIFYLSQCNSLVGIAASQIYRMAVAMANATGRLDYAVAMDYNDIPKITRLSYKWDVFFPEIFSLP